MTDTSTTILLLTFPILVFVPDYGGWAREGLEDLDYFYDEKTFTKVDNFTLKNRPHLKMLLIDSAGRTWRVAGFTDLGPWGTSWMKVLRMMTLGSRKIAFHLTEEPQIPFDQVKERVAASILTHPDHWRDDEAIAGEDGPIRDEQEMLDAFAQAARDAADLPALLDVLSWDDAGRQGSR
jgi:hypothetical protein